MKLSQGQAQARSRQGQANGRGHRVVQAYCQLQGSGCVKSHRKDRLDAIEMGDLMSGLGKTPFFGVIIAVIGCHHGLHTRGGTEGVGKSTTRAVVFVSVSVLLADFFLTKLFIALTPTSG